MKLCETSYVLGEAAQEAQKRARQQLQSFLLRLGHIYSGRASWSLAHMRWISTLTFDHIQPTSSFSRSTARRLRTLKCA
jgi:hypothetical protein